MQNLQIYWKEDIYKINLLTHEETSDNCTTNI